MIIDKEENVFKNLVKSTGYEPAPKSIMNRAMAHLKKDQKQSGVSNVILIPTWVWAAAFVLLCSVCFITFYQNPQAEFIFLSALFDKLGFLTFEGIALPDFRFASINKIVFLCALPAVILQFYFIKHFYERTL